MTKIAGKRNTLEDKLHDKMTSVGEARGKLAHIQLAAQMLEKGVKVPTDGDMSLLDGDLVEGGRSALESAAASSRVDASMEAEAAEAGDRWQVLEEENRLLRERLFQAEQKLAALGIIAEESLQTGPAPTSDYSTGFVAPAVSAPPSSRSAAASVAQPFQQGAGQIPLRGGAMERRVVSRSTSASSGSARPLVGFGAEAQGSRGALQGAEAPQTDFLTRSSQGAEAPNNDSPHVAEGHLLLAPQATESPVASAMSTHRIAQPGQPWQLPLAPQAIESPVASAMSTHRIAQPGQPWLFEQPAQMEPPGTLPAWTNTLATGQFTPTANLRPPVTTQFAPQVHPSPFAPMGLQPGQVLQAPPNIGRMMPSEPVAVPREPIMAPSLPKEPMALMHAGAGIDMTRRSSPTLLRIGGNLPLPQMKEVLAPAIVQHIDPRQAVAAPLQPGVVYGAVPHVHP